MPLNQTKPNKSNHTDVVKETFLGEINTKIKTVEASSHQTSTLCILWEKNQREGTLNKNLQFALSSAILLGLSLCCSYVDPKSAISVVQVNVTVIKQRTNYFIIWSILDILTSQISY